MRGVTSTLSAREDSRGDSIAAGGGGEGKNGLQTLASWASWSPFRNRISRCSWPPNSARKAEPTSWASAGSSAAVAFIHTATWRAFEPGYWTIARYAAWTVPFRTKNSESFALRSRSGGPSCSPRKTTPCSADLMSFPSGSCSGLDIGDEQRPCPTYAPALLERVLDKDFAHGTRKMRALGFEGHPRRVIWRWAAARTGGSCSPCGFSWARSS